MCAIQNKTLIMLISIDLEEYNICKFPCDFNNLSHTIIHITDKDSDSSDGRRGKIKNSCFGQYTPHSSRHQFR